MLEVISYLAKRDFHLRALEPVFVHRTTGELLQMDGLFVRSR